MADGNAKISENAINAGAVMGDVGTFSGTISELSLIQNSGLGSKSKYFMKYNQHSINIC